MPKKLNSNLPQTVYVMRVKTDSDDYLVAASNMKDCADMSEKRIVGVYEFREAYLVEGSYQQRLIA